MSLSRLFFLSLAFGAPLNKRSAPADDSFYTAPSSYDGLGPGDIIDSRSTYSLATVGSKEASQVKYYTTDAQNSSSYTVTTVYTPQNPKYPQKLVSVQTWQDSSGKNCAPSYGLTHGLLTPDGLTTSLDVAIVIDWALDNGYYVTVPDHEGPNNEFIVGHTEGQAGLDGIRAAISYLGLPDDTATVLYGYSGGSHATGWMANLHETYAPELNIVGSATGGTVIDLAATINKIKNTLFSGFMPSCLRSLLGAYPDQASQITPHISATGNKTLSKAGEDNFCMGQGLLRYPFTNVFAESDLDDLSTFPPMADILARESLLNNVSSLYVSVPKFPRYDYHATGDEVVPYSPDKEFIEQQCALGANIQLETYSLGGHITTMIFGLPGAIQFLDQALNDKTPTVECGTNNAASVNISSPNVDAVIGSATANRIRALNGKDTPLGRISW